MKFIIRPLDIEDIEYVCAIEDKVNPSPWHIAMFTNGLRVGYDAKVIEVENKIAGFAIFSIAADESQILNIAIAPHYQHQGLGTELLNVMLQDAAIKGAKKCYLDVRRSNINAQRFYQKLGFKEAGLRTKYYPMKDGWEDGIVMKKDLRS